MNLQTNIEKIKNYAKNAELIVVTKKQDVSTIHKIYNLGERQFGENRVNDLIEKKNKLPNDIKWHMIGHLQKNKVKFIIPFIYMIQSVDSIKLLEIINNYAQKNNKIIRCLIQIKIAKEHTKFGFKPQEAIRFLQSNYTIEFPNITICGIMGMASFTKEKHQIKSEFESIKKIYNTSLKSSLSEKILSIGMSQDYKIAYQTGSNMIRIGSQIFY